MDTIRVDDFLQLAANEIDDFESWLRVAGKEEINLKAQSSTRSLLRDVISNSPNGISRVELSIKAIPNKEQHPNGSDMWGQQQVAGRYYLLTNLNSEDKMPYVSELPEKVG